MFKHKTGINSLWSNLYGVNAKYIYMLNVNEIGKEKIEIKLFISHDWRSHFPVNKMLPAKWK